MDTRRRHPSPRLALLVALTGLLAPTLVACGSASTTTPVETTAPAATTASTENSTATSDVAETSEPTTTDTGSTAATTTTAQTDPLDAWTPIDYPELQMPLAYPCCASNWGLAEPSPPLPDPGEPLADGVYAVEWEWPADLSDPTVIAKVSRFDLCSALADGLCEEVPVGYEDSEYGEDIASIDVPITFDDDLTVIVGGYVGWEYPDDSSTLQRSTGTALVDLLTHLNSDYRLAVVEPVLAGSDPWSVAQLLAAVPEHGFSSPLGEPPNMGAGQIVYTYGDAPPLLFQALIPYDVEPAEALGADILGRIALKVEDGRYTVTLYAGYYS